MAATEGTRKMGKRRGKWEDIFQMSAKGRLLQRLRYDPQEAWNEFATLHAEHRNKNDFATRRGYFIVPDMPTASGKAFCLFDNRPYRKEGGGNTMDHRRRQKLMELFREKLRDAGISELGYGTYPPPGQELAGYTSAIILDADDSKTQIIIDGFHESVRETDEWHANARDQEHEPEHQLKVDRAEESVKEGSALPNLVNVGVASQVRQVRVGQDAFSRAVRENYGHRCCFPGCDVDHDDLLVAAHIDRWADNPQARGDVANGLCLCGLHDRAFECGFFTLTDQLLVKVDIRKAKLSKWVVSELQKADGLPIRTGKICPCAVAVAKHRERHASRVR
jgi:hypothetical protein